VVALLGDYEAGVPLDDADAAALSARLRDLCAPLQEDLDAYVAAAWQALGPTYLQARAPPSGRAARGRALGGHARRARLRENEAVWVSRAHPS
jgi:hypothetical protein